jgi:hypothetical protein
VVLSSVEVILLEPQARVQPSTSRPRVALAGLAGLLVWFAAAPAQAQSGAVKALFEKYNLVGVFAADCRKPPNAAANLYYVDRLIDADHVQRDTMEGPTKRTQVTIISYAWPMGTNEIGVLGKRLGDWTADAWRVDNKRMMQVEAVVAGKPIVAGGKLVTTGADMPWLNRCY